MKSKKEIKEWLLENCIDEFGDLHLSNLDFSDFDGNVYIDKMKVKKSLLQDYQQVGCRLYQSWQTVGGDLLQNWQKVGGNLGQCFQQVGGDFLTQTLDDDEEYKITDCYTYIVKKEEK